MSLKALEMEQLVPGQALPWDVVDDGGRILLPKGTPVGDEAQARSLFTRGWAYEPDALPGAAGGTTADLGNVNSWRRKPVDAPASNRPRFFHALERFILPLEEVIADLLTGKGKNLSDHILQLCSQIQLQVARDADALLAALELFDGGRYGTIHALSVATLCELIYQLHEPDPAQRRPLLAAALTRDIGFLELQDELDRQSEPLSRKQQDEVRAHPLASIRLLKEAAVTHVDWLTAVGQHHERLNGSGYPQGLSGEQISLWARILAITDTYSALTKTRAYRPAIQGASAMMALFKTRGSLVDDALTQDVIRTLGLWPPGLLVRLANGETAVVIRRTANLKAPEVRVVADVEGKPLHIYQIRDASEPDFLIQEALPRSSPLRERLNHRQLWGEITLQARR